MRAQLLPHEIPITSHFRFDDDKFLLGSVKTPENLNSNAINCFEQLSAGFSSQLRPDERFILNLVTSSVDLHRYLASPRSNSNIVRGTVFPPEHINPMEYLKRHLSHDGLDLATINGYSDWYLLALSPYLVLPIYSDGTGYDWVSGFCSSAALL